MPSLDWNRRFGVDVVRFSRSTAKDYFYGDQWGSVEDRNDLLSVRKKYLDPFVSSDAVCLEIGSGGGRWTKYLLPCKQLVCVELNCEMLDYIRRRFDNPRNVWYITTNGYDLPSVPKSYVDYVFSFGTFVHLEMEIIARYVESISEVMKSGAHVVLQVSNRHKTNAMTEKPSFSENSPEFMVEVLSKNGINVSEIDNDTLFHSTVILGHKT